MSTTIPLIRGFALLPTLRWLSANGGSIERRLEEVDLPTGLGSNPFRPIPLVHVAALAERGQRLRPPSSVPDYFGSRQH